MTRVLSPRSVAACGAGRRRDDLASLSRSWRGNRNRVVRADSCRPGSARLRPSLPFAEIRGARLCPSRFHPSWEGERTREPILGCLFRFRGCKNYRSGGRGTVRAAISKTERATRLLSRLLPTREREAPSEPAVRREQEGEALSEPVSSILGGRAYSRADIGLPVSSNGLQVPPLGSARL